MSKKSAFGSVRRFGSRYGKTVKDKFGKIESVQHALHKCPYCSREAVKREAAGIWLCKKCGSKFASKAYTVAKLPKLKVSVAEI